ncbi:hypothetical protein F4V43_15415 [Paenibacillus spiritus]|uniref:Sporulation membrane protein YtrI C-terminal domain-containing protein n=1 Tax=Paenibacillus spiritus TaxID=2496557 RepID=A0A5J5FZV5_9BACL|nr:hypothetical protein [Paenibacillus spiritus]KAA8999715.1 hypothetical protein F4V43_15415 [Paenibacillus spiritus]
MRIPPFGRFRRFSQLAASCVLGMVLGSVFYNSVFHAGYNALWLDNQDLRVRLSQYEKDIVTLKKYKNSSSVIKEIKIRAEDASARGETSVPDAVTVKDIVSRLGADLAPMRGRSVFDIDTDAKMARLLLGGKVYIVRDKEYAVTIRTMLVMEGVLQIWVEIGPARRP